MNSRGAGPDNPLRSPQAYSASYTDDLRAVVQHLRKTLPIDTPLYLIGFSLGANIITKFLGEEGAKQLTLHRSLNQPGNALKPPRPAWTAAIAVANPFDLENSSRHLHQSWILRVLVSPVLGQALAAFYLRHRQQLIHVVQRAFGTSESTSTTATSSSSSTSIIPAALTDAERAIFACRSIREFDSLLTARCFHFPSVRWYYRKASSDQYVSTIAQYTLFIQNHDDPIAHHLGAPLEDIEQNPFCTMLMYRSGGHSISMFGWPSIRSAWSRLNNRLSQRHLSSNSAWRYIALCFIHLLVDLVTPSCFAPQIIHEYCAAHQIAHLTRQQQSQQNHHQLFEYSTDFQRLLESHWVRHFDECLCSHLAARH